MSEILIFCTTDTPESARKIADDLVEAHAAACVNIVSGIRSVYRWEGKLCDEKEILILIKSSAEKFETVRNRIRQLHSYETPEIIAIPITACDPDYLSWLRSSLK